MTTRRKAPSSHELGSRVTRASERHGPPPSEVAAHRRRLVTHPRHLFPAADDRQVIVQLAKLVDLSGAYQSLDPPDAAVPSETYLVPAASALVVRSVALWTRPVLGRRSAPSFFVGRAPLSIIDGGGAQLSTAAGVGPALHNVHGEAAGFSEAVGWPIIYAGERIGVGLRRAYGAAAVPEPVYATVLGVVRGWLVPADVLASEVSS